MLFYTSVHVRACVGYTITHWGIGKYIKDTCMHVTRAWRPHVLHMSSMMSTTLPSPGPCRMSRSTARQVRPAYPCSVLQVWSGHSVCKHVCDNIDLDVMCIWRCKHACIHVLCKIATLVWCMADSMMPVAHNTLWRNLMQPVLARATIRPLWSL